MRGMAVTCVMLVLVAIRASSQTVPDSLSPVTRISAEDSAAVATLLAGRRTVDTLSSSQRGGKSPALALLLSAALPGAGQFYNESYWKIPILLGFGYYFATRWIDNNDSTKHYRSLYAQSITADRPGGNSRFLQLREFYKDQRDTFSWYIFIYYLVNLVDAYVDASLYDFNVGDDLSLRVLPQTPPVARPGIGVSVRLRF